MNVSRETFQQKAEELGLHSLVPSPFDSTAASSLSSDFSLSQCYRITISGQDPHAGKKGWWINTIESSSTDDDGDPDSNMCVSLVQDHVVVVWSTVAMTSQGKMYLEGSPEYVKEQWHFTNEVYYHSSFEYSSFRLDEPMLVDLIQGKMEQSYPGEMTYTVDFLGPCYSDATLGPTSLEEALKGQCGEARTNLGQGGAFIEIDEANDDRGTTYAWEIAFPQGGRKLQTILSGTMSSLREVKEMLLSLHIDPDHLWAGNDAWSTD